MNGAEAHYNMGKDFVRAEYMTKLGFLSETWNPSEIYVQTSYKDRAIDSGRSQLSGIYNNPLVWP